jgi:hypothetical protein
MVGALSVSADFVVKCRKASLRHEPVLRNAVYGIEGFIPRDFLLEQKGVNAKTLSTLR